VGVAGLEMRDTRGEIPVSHTDFDETKIVSDVRRVLHAEEIHLRQRLSLQFVEILRRFKKGNSTSRLRLSLPMSNLKGIAERLARAVHDRAEYISLLLARRVLSLAPVLTSSELDRLKSCVSTVYANEVSAALQGVNRVGPVALERF
jgi:hypothetical protein